MTRRTAPATPAERRIIVKAALLRDKLTDKALALRFDLSISMVKGIVERGRRASARGKPMRQYRITNHQQASP